MPVRCPKCRFEQDGGEECLRCGIIYRKYKPPQTSATATAESPVALATATDELKLSFKPDSPVSDEAPPPSELEEDTEYLQEPERPRSTGGWFRRVIRIFPWISLAVLVGALYLIFQEAPPLQIQMDPDALARFDRKMQDLQMAAQMGQPHTLSLDEAELNAWLRANMALAPEAASRQGSGMRPQSNIPVDDPRFRETQAAMKDLRVKLTGDKVQAYAVFNFHGRNLSLILEGRIHMADGYLRLEPTDGRIGSLPIPQVTLDHVVQRLFESPESRDNFQLSPSISNVDIRKGRLFVFYQ